MAGKHYDLIVIGAGSGLDVVVGAANNYDWKVALVEKGPLGGTCLNRGCIPSKMIIHAADVAEQINTASTFGINAQINSIDFASITRRANDHVDHEAESIEKGLSKHPKIDLYKTTGEFTAPKTLKVDSEEITGKRVLIAARSRPLIPPIEGLDQIDYWTSTEALRQTEQPQSLIIIGGGYIGAELGHFYGALGTKVTVVQRGDLLINHEDLEVSQTFTRVFSQKNNVLLNQETRKIEQKDDGTKVIHLVDQNGDEKTIEAEALLITTGIRPNTDTLKIENTHVEVNEQGYIQANEFMETTEEDVWALGDIVGKAPFKHGANYEAQRVFWNIRGERQYPVDYSIMPHAIFSSPQVAGVGLTEEEAEEKGVNYEVKIKNYEDTGMGRALDEHDGFVKFIINPDESKILGCHILGPEASTLIHEVVVAMSATGGKISAIKNAVHVHPALSEVVHRAL